jgi:beta-lactamase class D
MQEFQDILDSANVEGAVLIFDPEKYVYYSNDFTWCQRGFLPASTFKIPNALIALETGVVEGDSTLFAWDGQPRRMDIWEKDLNFRDAFHLSCVPCFQDIARRIGPDRMRRYLDTLKYGHMIFDSITVDRFWLEGESRISQEEQVDFLVRFYYSQLPLSDRTAMIMKRLMVIEERDGFRLSGKTGWSIRNGNNNGWFVGYLEKNDRVLFIATNINPKKAFDLELFSVIRRDISVQALNLFD